MKKVVVAIFALGALALTMAAALPPPEERPAPKKQAAPPPPPGPPRFELGRVLPPHFRDELDLSEAQETQLDELEHEVRERVLRMLSPEQRTKLHELRRQRRGNPPNRPPGAW